MVIPLYPNILLKPCLKESGGISLPDEMKEQHGEAIIEEVYEGCTKLKKGEKVIFKKYKPDQISISDQILYLAREEDIMARICVKEKVSQK